MKNQKLSESMKLAHASGKHPGWKHINESQDRLSYPESFIKKVLIENNIFFNYTVVPHLSAGKYFLDFAILELKLDIEVDGCQHYRDIDAIEHDKTRDAFLRENGWTVYRINWKEFYNNTKTEISELLNYIENFDNSLDRYYEITVKEKTESLPRGVTKRLKSDQKWEPYKQIILDSNIDFTKYGWVNEVAKVLSISPQKVNKWMIRYLPDQYEKCFKRNR